MSAPAFRTRAVLVATTRGRPLVWNSFAGPLDRDVGYVPRLATGSQVLPDGPTHTRTEVAP